MIVITISYHSCHHPTYQQKWICYNKG